MALAEEGREAEGLGDLVFDNFVEVIDTEMSECVGVIVDVEEKKGSNKHRKRKKAETDHHGDPVL